MSRVKYFAHSLFSGYLLLGCNVLYTLVSFRLALHYLSKAEFGLWMLTIQIAVFVGLLDLGMAGASRILVDHKDQKADGAYGSVVQTTFLVSCVQGLGIFLCGSLLALWLPPSALSVPDDLHRPFLLLLIGQCAFLAATFFSRTLNFLLMAHQRYDVLNYLACVSFLINFGTLWLAFEREMGILSLILAQFSGWLVGAVGSAWSCQRLGFFPPREAWGQASWQRTKELLAYGMDFFFFALGAQLLATSQSVLITRFLGLESVAVWSFCTRAFVMIQQIVFRVFDFSAAALAEMIVRDERHRLKVRFHNIVSLSAALAVWAGIALAFCNQPFVELWSKGKAGWPLPNDLLLFLATVISVVAYAHVGLVGQAKDFRMLRYLYLFEAVVFVLLGIWLLPRLSFTGLLIASLAATALFSLPYGIWRTARYFGLSWKVVAGHWSKPAFILGLFLWPVGFALFWGTRGMPAAARFTIIATGLSVLGAIVLFRYGLEVGLRAELLQRFSAFMGRRTFFSNRRQE